MTNKPTIEEILDGLDDETFEEVHEEHEPEDYGHATWAVVKRIEDSTFWSYSYVVQSCYNSLHDDPGSVEVSQVWPVTKTVTDYVSKDPNNT